MSSQAYVKGRAFEYRVMQELERRGWFCVRSAGSHGPADIVCIKEGEPILIQAQTQCHFSRAKIDALKVAARKCKCRAYIVYRSKSSLVFYRVHPEPPIAPVSETWSDINAQAP